MIQLANLGIGLLLCVASLDVGLIAVRSLDRAGSCNGPTRLMAELLVGILIVHFAIWSVGNVRHDTATTAGLGMIIPPPGYSD